MIPAEAVEAAAKMMAMSSAEAWSDEQWDNPRVHDAYRQPWRDEARRILEAAAPHRLAALTAESPRLPTEVRNQLFEILGDFMDKFELESRIKGPNRHIAATGYEWGDMCGYFERRIVAALRTPDAV